MCGALLLLHWVKIAFCVCWSVAVLAAAEAKAAAVAVPNAPSAQKAADAALAAAEPYRDPFVSSVPGFVDFVPTAKDWDGMDDGMLDLEGACSCQFVVICVLHSLTYRPCFLLCTVGQQGLPLLEDDDVLNFDVAGTCLIALLSDC